MLRWAARLGWGREKEAEEGVGGEGRGRTMEMEGWEDGARHSGIGCSGSFCVQMAEMRQVMSHRLLTQL